MVLVVSCATKAEKMVDDGVSFARRQIGCQIEQIENSGNILNPVTTNREGKTAYCGVTDWRSGFFPGSVWYLYELTSDTTLLPLAVKYTEAIADAQYLTSHHDIGFIINCSFGNGLRIEGTEAYRQVIVTAAQSLSTRFREVAGVIQSWNTGGGWQSERGWQCPVIIDNMMNLELLFKAAQISGDSTFYRIAVSHADRTLAEHFRPDGSCYHVIDYSLEDGTVQHRQTAQGYSDESVWSRGQAWAIYGFEMCYRFTGDRRYLDQAIKTFRFMRDHPSMAADHIPYWDMDDPAIPNAPRDVSSASCIASALYQIGTMDVDDAQSYIDYADSIMQSLATPAYRAELGKNGNFILMHSVGSIPHNAEVDVPLNYADYYYLEALKLRRDICRAK